MLGDDAAEATASHGHAINKAILTGTGRDVATLRAAPAPHDLRPTHETVERIWAGVLAARPAWQSLKTRPGQTPAPAGDPDSPR